MHIYSISTWEYDADIRKLLTRRLKRLGSEIEVRGEDEKHAQAEIQGIVQAEEWCAAIAGLLLRDLAHFEMARLVNALPITLAEKQMVLPEAIKVSREVGSETSIFKELIQFYETKEDLNLEGYLRFRMRDVQKDWEMCVMRAAEEVLLQSEYMELMQVLSAFIQIRPPQIKDVYVILNPDGSCTLTDDQDSRIDYERCTGDGVMSVLVGLSPERITVYDLSGGKSNELAETLMKVFEDRVRFFK